MSNDPTAPGFWDDRLREHQTPWDAGATPPALERFLAQMAVVGGRVLIPGCGLAYEVESFARKGFDVTAIDFSPVAVEQARQRYPVWRERIILADFFTHDFGPQPFDLIYERAFLASLPAESRSRYAARVATLLRSGGLLAGFFVYGAREGGPPFLLQEGEPQRLLGKDFHKIVEVPVTESVRVFAGRERWEEWLRRE